MSSSALHRAHGFRKLCQGCHERKARFQYAESFVPIAITRCVSSVIAPNANVSVHGPCSIAPEAVCR